MIKMDENGEIRSNYLVLGSMAGSRVRERVGVVTM